MTPQAPKAADKRVEAGIEFLKNPSLPVSGFAFIVDNRPAIDFSKPSGPVKWVLPQAQIVALYHPSRAQREGKK